MSRIPLVGALLLLSSCSSPTLVDVPSLSAAQTKWGDRGFADYEVEMRIVCFCPPEITVWSKVRVQAGEITGVWRVEDSEPVAEGSWGVWPTVEELFDRLGDVGQSEVYREVVIDYHPELGYPTSADFIEKEGIADASISYDLRSAGPATN